MASTTDWSFEHPANLKIVGKVGEGAFGTVVKALDADGKELAIKRIRNYASMPGKIQRNYALKICREVETLSLLQGSPFVVPLHSVYLSADKLDVYLVMPYISFDLQNVVEARVLQEDAVKWITYQMLVGLDNVHRRKMMHRDMTLRNILVSDEFDVFLADFGLARAHEAATEDSTLSVCTLQYRDPAILLAYPKYNSSCDCWSLGCMVAELYLRHRLLEPQRPDIPCQVTRIIQVLGKPDVEFVRNHASPSAFNFFQNLLTRFEAAEKESDGPSCYESPIQDQLAAAGASKEAIEVILGLLQFDFRKRLTASQALKMPWFKNDEEYAGLEGVVDAPRPAPAPATSGEDGVEKGAAAAAEEEVPEPGSPLQAEATGNNDIIEMNETLRALQKADIDELRAYMEKKAVPVENRVRGQYNTATQVAENL